MTVKQRKKPLTLQDIENIRYGWMGRWTVRKLNGVVIEMEMTIEVEMENIDDVYQYIEDIQDKCKHQIIYHLDTENNVIIFHFKVTKETLPRFNIFKKLIHEKHFAK